MAKVYYYKNAKILAPFSIISNQPVFEATSVSLKTQRVNQQHQRWELDFNTVMESNNQVEGFLASFESLDTAETFIMPQFPSVNEAHTGSGNPIVAVSADIGDDTVVVDSSTVSGLIPKGSFVKFSNHDKVYCLTADLDMDSGSTATASLYPQLRKDVTPSSVTLLTQDSVVLSYYRSIDAQTGITFNEGILSNTGAITLIEAI
jgi:hypothetical protein